MDVEQSYKIQEYFYQAVFDGNPHGIKEQIENGANVNARSESGHSAVSIAALGGYVDIIRTLHEYGADMSIPAFDGCTPLHIASEDGDMDVIKTLVRLGGDINATMSDGCTPMSVAARSGQVEAIKFYYEMGAGICKEGPGAPLTLALRYNQQGAVQCLGEILSRWTSKCESCGCGGCEDVRYCSAACQAENTTYLIRKFVGAVFREKMDNKSGEQVDDGTRMRASASAIAAARPADSDATAGSESDLNGRFTQPDPSKLKIIRTMRMIVGFLIVIFVLVKCTDLVPWVR